MVSQNKPFTPIYDAWKAGSRDILPLDDELARQQVAEIMPKVLSNRKPPYSLVGGLYDAMKDAGGDVLLASNDEAINASELFEATEGIDIHPAAAIATATLINSVKEGRLKKDALIMLNITGGGEERFKQENELYYLKPSMTFDIDPDFDEVKDYLQQLF
jgi:cysteate synthase